MKKILSFLLLAFSLSSFGQQNFAIKKIDIINVKCNGESTGRITITVTGGFQPFKYSINGGIAFQSSNTFANLNAGSYTVRVKDSLNRITRDSVVKILQPAKLFVNVSAGSSIKCNGDSTGSLNAVASGGTVPYSYLWSNGSQKPGQSKLPAGIYAITVLDSVNCSANGTATITQPALLRATASGTNLTCVKNSGSVTVSVTGGTVPYWYLWSNGSQNISQSGLAAGLYSVTVTDSNNCKSTSSVTLIQKDSLTKKYNIGDSTSCGYVFYVDPRVDSLNPCSTRYLVCAFKDQNPGISWYNGTYLTTNATIDGLFDKTNADQIIKVQGDSSYAANVCAKYHVADSSCTGWYLPSKAELELMYNNLAAKKIGGFAKEGYWSSLEEAKKTAWIVDFLNGRTFPVKKVNKYHIRAIKEIRR